MINLLPPQEKENIQGEKKLRMILNSGILFLVFLISFSLILLAIKIIISSQVEIQSIILERGESEFQKSQIKEFQKIIDSSNETISELNSFYRREIDFTYILEEISRTLPEKTHLINIFFSSQTDKDGERILNCNLSGFSSTREILLQFKKNLENEDNFKEVYFPPSNWIAPNDINFSINFKIIH